MRALSVALVSASILVLTTLVGYAALPECPEEDSLNCVWLESSGNGVGASYVTLSNDTLFLQVNLSE